MSRVSRNKKQQWIGTFAFLESSTGVLYDMVSQREGRLPIFIPTLPHSTAGKVARTA